MLLTFCLSGPLLSILGTAERLYGYYCIPEVLQIFISAELDSCMEEDGGSSLEVNAPVLLYSRGWGDTDVLCALQ